MRWPQLIMARLPAKRKLYKRLCHAATDATCGELHTQKVPYSLAGCVQPGYAGRDVAQRLVTIWHYFWSKVGSVMALFVPSPALRVVRPERGTSCNNSSILRSRARDFPRPNLSSRCIPPRCHRRSRIHPIQRRWPLSSSHPIQPRNQPNSSNPTRQRSIHSNGSNGPRQRSSNGGVGLRQLLSPP